MIRWISLFIVGFGVALSAAADPTGAWVFETKIKDKGCTISGTMVIDYPVDGVHACSFVSTEICEVEGSPPIIIDQACSVSMQEGDTLLIMSELIQSLTEDYSLAWYNPDHFAVQPNGPSEMIGTWWDRNFSAPVRFWREKAAPIS